MARPSKGARILVVDGHDERRLVSREILARAGHDVSEASTVADAWAWLPGVELAMVDVNLPDGSGIDLTGRVRADPRFENLSILLTSATAHRPDEQAAGLDTGADAYMS